MVECCTQPIIHVVTNLTVGGEFGSYMTFGSIVLSLVTGNTFIGYFLIASTFMTVCTDDIMPTCEWK